MGPLLIFDKQSYMASRKLGPSHSHPSHSESASAGESPGRRWPARAMQLLAVNGPQSRPQVAQGRPHAQAQALNRGGTARTRYEPATVPESRSESPAGDTAK